MQTKSDISLLPSNYRIPIIFLLTLLPSLAQPVLAHKGATGVVKQRMELMEKIGDSMKEMKGMMKNEAPFDAVKVMQNALTIHQASRRVTKLFPEGSIHGPSEALPEIWKDWERFSTLSNTFTLEAKKLLDIAGQGNQKASMKQFRILTKTCRSCHSDFREKK